MAHLLKIIKVRSLKHKWKDYLQEKKIGINEEESDELTTDCLFGQNPQRFGFINKTFLAMSLSGFIGGVLLTYILFIFFYIGVSFSLRTTTHICGLASFFLCLGLAFSPTVRCYTLLLLSALFSKQGRQALLAYALFLAFTGPARNTMHNLGVLSDSMTCSQEMVKRTLKQILEMMKLPFNPIKETMEKLTKTLKNVVESMKTCIRSIKKIIVIILSVFQKATEWLESILYICNQKMGTPYERCTRTFENAIVGCKAKLGSLDVLCNAAQMVKVVCCTVKCFDLFCTELTSEATTEVIKRRLCLFGLRMKNVLYVSIEFNHTYLLETTARNTTKDVTNSIVIKFKKKIEKLQSVFSYFGFTFSLILPFLVFKACNYKYKYLTSDRYDNVYISRYIVDLDLKRVQMDKETILPLECREKERYAKPTSIRLVKMEEHRYTQSMFFLILASFKVITFLAIDYSLFWILLTIYEAGHDAMEGVERSKLVVHVNGRGILAGFYRNLSKAFQVPENPNVHLTPLRCLPDPSRPDTRRYIQIGFLAAISWLLTLAEPYGLRLRGVVMSHYYPDRAKERAVWLYNHILRSRGSFLRCARRQLRKKFSGRVHLMEEETLTQRLFTGFPLLEIIFGKTKENNCILCEKRCNDICLKRCKTPDCPGRYDMKCYTKLENVCTICRLPVEYGDISDISEEIDSSDEEFCHEKSDSESEKFLTFKEMEIREGFRDVEANKIPDYARLADLYPKKVAIKRRLKEVLSRHIENARSEKRRNVQNKQSKYKRVKCMVQERIENLKAKKSQEILEKKTELKKKVAEKVESLRNLKQNRASESEILLEKKPKGTRSRVSFKLDFEEVKAKTDYYILKEKLRATVNRLKQKKNSV